MESRALASAQCAAFPQSNVSDQAKTSAGNLPLSGALLYDLLFPAAKRARTTAGIANAVLNRSAFVLGSTRREDEHGRHKSL